MPTILVPPPPVVVAANTGLGRPIAGLTIDSPPDGATVDRDGVVVTGRAPSDAPVVRDAGFCCGEQARADAWGHWAMPLHLGRGEQVLTFRVGDDRSTARQLRLEVGDDRSPRTIVWPAKAETVSGSPVVVRGLAAPGADVRQDRGGLDGLFGGGPKTTADSLGRWQLPVKLEPGANDVTFAIGSTTAVRHIVRDDSRATARTAPELEVVDRMLLPFRDPGAGSGAQVVVVVRNRSSGWLDLAPSGTGVPAPAVRVGGSAAAPVAAIPRFVGPDATAFLVATVREPRAASGSAADVSLDEGVGYSSPPTPADAGTVDTFRVDATSGAGVSIHGRFRAGAVDPRFRVAVLAYGHDGHLVGVATQDSAASGAYDACCLPLFGPSGRDEIARLVGIVSTGSPAVQG